MSYQLDQTGLVGAGSEHIVDSGSVSILWLVLALSSEHIVDSGSVLGHDTAILATPRKRA